MGFHLEVTKNKYNYPGKIHYLGGLPASGPLRGTAGKGESQFLSLIRRGGALFWGGGVYRKIENTKDIDFNNRHQIEPILGFFPYRDLLQHISLQIIVSIKKKKLHNFLSYNNPDEPRNHTTT